MTDETMEVDISNDDATLDEIDEDADRDGPEPEPERKAVPSDEHIDLEEQAKEEAVRLRENAEGRNQTERTQNAIEQAKQSLRDCAQQLQSVGQERTQAENRIERLEMTKDRVDEQPDDCQILQTLAGGVSMEVPPDEHTTLDDAGIEQEGYTRSDLVDEIDETIEALEGKLEGLDESERKLTQSMQKTKMAGERLEDFLEMLEASGSGGGQDVGGAQAVDQPYGGEMPR